MNKIVQPNWYIWVSLNDYKQFGPAVWPALANINSVNTKIRKGTNKQLNALTSQNEEQKNGKALKLV